MPGTARPRPLALGLPRDRLRCISVGQPSRGDRPHLTGPGIRGPAGLPGFRRSVRNRQEAVDAHTVRRSRHWNRPMTCEIPPLAVVVPARRQSSPAGAKQRPAAGLADHRSLAAGGSCRSRISGSGEERAKTRHLELAIDRSSAQTEPTDEQRSATPWPSLNGKCSQPHSLSGTGIPGMGACSSTGGAAQSSSSQRRRRGRLPTAYLGRTGARAA